MSTIVTETTEPHFQIVALETYKTDCVIRLGLQQDHYPTIQSDNLARIISLLEVEVSTVVYAIFMPRYIPHNVPHSIPHYVPHCIQHCMLNCIPYYVPHCIPRCMLHCIPHYVPH